MSCLQSHRFHCVWQGEAALTDPALSAISAISSISAGPQVLRFYASLTAALRPHVLLLRKARHLVISLPAATGCARRVTQLSPLLLRKVLCIHGVRAA